jgi:3-oxoacyl-[acyl-carrier-protein] synthase-1/3-oxoacyl-[acyl-carrier-protein] synthase II
VQWIDYAHVREVDRAWLSAMTGVARDRLARIDDLGQLALSAVATLVEKIGRERIVGAGVVAGYSLATLDTNERFIARLLEKGPRRVDPRLFPDTSPNAGAGHCAIAYGLTGPNFAVNAGMAGAVEALLAAAELVAAGDAPRMLVVAADDAGPAARCFVELVAPERALERGAVALLLEAGERASLDTSPGRRVELDPPPSRHSGGAGHLALLDWLRSHQDRQQDRP